MLRLTTFALCALATSAMASECVYKDVMTAEEISACRDAQPAPEPSKREARRTTSGQQKTWSAAQQNEFEQRQAVERARQEEKTRLASAPYEPSIGMSEAEVRSTQYIRTWCSNPKINRTKTSRGVHEQWVCINRYFYLDNGVLTSIQEVDR